jgi:hypothetical protein
MRMHGKDVAIQADAGLTGALWSDCAESGKMEAPGTVEILS